MRYYQQTHTTQKLPIGKIIGLARTYPQHAQEMHSHPASEPLLFLKPSSSIIFNHDPIILPPQSTSIHHEVELGIVIKKTASKINKKNVLDYIYGYVLALDITARDIQASAKQKGLPWSTAKGFDTFCPISPIIPASQIKNPHNLTLTLRVNKEIRQQASTQHLLFPLSTIISVISWIMTLERGDLILTGTPAGVGEIKDGDTLDASLDSYVSLHHEVQRQTKLEG